MVTPRVFLGLVGMSFVLLLTCSEVSAVNVDVTDGFTTTLDVGADGTYDFSLLGDEGSSRLLIDGNIIIDGSSTFGSAWLTQGVHSLQIEFDACCGGIQLVVPEDVTLQPVALPEPHALVLLGAGLAGLALAARMRARVRTAGRPIRRS
jgi:hypothetical protein